MDHVERFRAVMAGQPVDRLPRIEWALWWDKTISRWQGEGLALDDRYELYRHFGLDVYWQHWFCPRTADCPWSREDRPLVADHADYEEMLPQLFPPIDELEPTFAAWADAQRRGEGLVWMTLEGFFWYPRWLMGIEPHLYAFYDQPELMHRINADLADWSVSVLQRLADLCPPAFFTIGEDMSYNHGPMLSRAQFQEFIAPYYGRIIPLMHEMGATVIVDTDGDVTAMIPWLQETGVDGVLPLERRAGVDALAIRREFPTLAMIGHFDKTVMCGGEATMRAEFDRLLPLMRGGRFLPSVDHQTPPDVSLEQYRTYVRLLGEYTELASR